MRLEGGVNMGYLPLRIRNYENRKTGGSGFDIIYIIIRHCPGVGAFPRPFCVPNSVALASLTPQVGDWAIH